MSVECGCVRRQDAPGFAGEPAQKSPHRGGLASPGPALPLGTLVLLIARETSLPVALCAQALLGPEEMRAPWPVSWVTDLGHYGVVVLWLQIREASQGQHISCIDRELSSKVFPRLFMRREPGWQNRSAMQMSVTVIRENTNDLIRRSMFHDCLDEERRAGYHTHARKYLQ